jgi:hypothetical protein
VVSAGRNDGRIEMAGTVTLTRTCTWCRKPASVEVDADGYKEYLGGAFAQTAFPGLDAGEREIIISGTHPACWEAMFPPAEDE